MLTAWRALRTSSRGARLYLLSASVMGFTIFGGVYSLLLNLYLLRLGYGPEFVGLLHAVSLLGWALACLPAGHVGRRLGSRRAMAVGMAGALVGHALLPMGEGFAGGWRATWLVGTYLLGNVSVALYDVNSQPFLTEATTAATRDQVFSLQAAFWPLAGFAGSLVGGALPGALAPLLGTSTGSPAPYRYPLIAAAAAIGLGVWAVSAARDPRAVPPEVVPPVETPVVPTAARIERAHAARVALFALLGVALLLQGAAEGAARTFFTVYMDEALRTPTARIGLLAALAQFAGAPAALLMPAAARRWGHRRVFMGGSAAMAASLLPLALLRSSGAAGAGYVAVIVLASLSRPAVLVFLMESSSAAQRTTASAVYTMAIGLSWAVTSLGGGFLIAGVGYRVFFLVAAAATVAGVALFRVARPVERPAVAPISP